jgi:2-haloacid dehalogenase
MKNIFLVDADDTLLDFHGASAIALKTAFIESGVAWEDRFLSEFKVINAGLWEALERKELTRKELMERRFHIFLKYMGMDSIDADAFNQIFLKHLATHPIYIDGAQEFLTELRKLGRVYIVTNGTAWIQKSRFDISNLWSYAEEVFVSDLIGFDKPAPEYTQYVINHIPDFCVENAVWIGDSISADIKAANDAKITSIWYNRHSKTLTGNILPDYTFVNFEEILTFLQKIN